RAEDEGGHRVPLGDPPARVPDVLRDLTVAGVRPARVATRPCAAGSRPWRLRLHRAGAAGAMRDMKKLLALALGVALLTACAHQAPRNPMATWVPSPNDDARRPVIIVLHYTEQGAVEESLHTLRTRNSGGPVSSHYLVGEDGALCQLVSDAHRAWHAGGGRWGTITDLNSASIGIEIDNDGREPFTEPQVQALLRLLEDLTTRLRIPRTQVIGHSDLAPSRKVDPGALFPWRR